MEFKVGTVAGSRQYTLAKLQYLQFRNCSLSPELQLLVGQLPIERDSRDALIQFQHSKQAGVGIVGDTRFEST